MPENNKPKITEEQLERLQNVVANVILAHEREVFNRHVEGACLALSLGYLYGATGHSTEWVFVAVLAATCLVAAKVQYKRKQDQRWRRK